MNKQSRLAPVPTAGRPLTVVGTNLSKPWGNQPICPGCNRGKTYSCICDPFFEDEDTPEPRFDPEGGWAFAERSALGMVKP